MTAAQLAIDIKGLSINYGRKRVLSNIFLAMPKGYTYGIVGPNGAGKSTLFKSILDLIDITAGEITILGGDINESRTRIAYVPQKDEVDWQFPATVKDIVAMGRYPHKGLFDRMNAEDDQIINKAMVDMGIADLSDRQIGQLSGGQQQRVFIARALAQEAEIFLLDEPFVGVDMLTEEKIINMLQKLADQNKTLLVVHHDLSTVEQYFDKLVLLNQRLVAYGDTKTVFNSENLAKAYGSQLNILHKL